MKRVLSTKILTASQVQLLINANVSLTQFAAIEIKPIEFEVPDKIDKAIFSSQNAVKRLLESAKKTEISEVFCVGTQTAALLTKNGENVVKTCNNSTELAQYLIKSFNNDVFYFYCGSQRRDELPDAVNASNNQLIEVKTYKTESKSRKIEGFFDGIMFFSPSGVASYAASNAIENGTAFCIGETTAASARQITEKVYVANTPTVESVIAKTVKILSND